MARAFSSLLKSVAGSFLKGVRLEISSSGGAVTVAINASLLMGAPDARLRMMGSEFQGWGPEPFILTPPYRCLRPCNRLKRPIERRVETGRRMNLQTKYKRPPLSARPHLKTTCVLDYLTHNSR